MINNRNPLVEIEGLKAVELPEYNGLAVRKLATISLSKYFPHDHTLKEELANKLSEYGDIDLEIISTLSALNAEKANDRHLVSIIIPTHNCDIFIGQTLQKIEQQDYHPFEVLIVDDGSTDCTKEIIKNILCKYHDTLRARFVELPNIGSPAAIRNFALYNLLSPQCSFVTFMDADDLYAGADALGKLARPLIENTHYTCTYGAYDFISENGGALAGPPMLKRRKDKTWEWREQRKLTWLNMATKRVGAYHLQCLMVRLPMNYMPYYNFGEDSGYIARVVRHASEVSGGALVGINHVPEIIFHYRKRGSGISVNRRRCPERHHGTKKFITPRKIPDLYVECGMPDKYITQTNISEFYARKWVPRIFNAIFRMRFRDAINYFTSAIKEHNLSALLLLLILFKDMATSSIFHEFLLSKFRRSK